MPDVKATVKLAVVENVPNTDMMLVTFGPGTTGNEDLGRMPDINLRMRVLDTVMDRLEEGATYELTLHKVDEYHKEVNE